MTYQETLDWLFVQLPMYQREGKAAYKKDLSNTLKLAKKLGNPKKNFKAFMSQEPMAKDLPVICWPLFCKRKV